MESHYVDFFVTSGWYRLMLYSAMIPSVYFIRVTVGGLRRVLGMSFVGVLVRTVISWVCIMGIYILSSICFCYACGDLGAFMDADTGSNFFIRVYPVGAMLAAVAGFYFPRADVFNKNKTRGKRLLLWACCFTPLVMMLAYMPLVKAELWKQCLVFGFKSSTLPLVIAFPVICFGSRDSLTMAFYLVVRGLFGTFGRRMPAAQP